MAEMLHSECEVFTTLVDWVTRLVAQDVPDGIYLLYGKAQGVKWDVLFEDEINWKKIHEMFYKKDPDWFRRYDVPQDLSELAQDEANAANVRFANYLREYGIYTVHSRDWYYERHSGRGLVSKFIPSFPVRIPTMTQEMTRGSTQRMVLSTFQRTIYVNGSSFSVWATRCTTPL